MRKITLCLTLCALLFAFIAEAQAPRGNMWYRIEHGQNKKNIANAGGESTGAAPQAKSIVKKGGHWKAISMGGGLYRFQNRNSGMFLANFQARNEGAIIKQTATPGPGALWRLQAMQGGYFGIINNQSGMYLGLANFQDGSNLIQTRRVTGWRFVGMEAITAETDTKAGTNWVESPIPTRFYGTWRIFSRNASRNDVMISSTRVMSGRVDMKIVKSYEKGGVYKVITTLNNYYQCHYFKDRTSGYTKTPGIYLNSTNSHAFRSFQEAMNVPIPDQLDEGYKN